MNAEQKELIRNATQLRSLAEDGRLGPMDRRGDRYTFALYVAAACRAIAEEPDWQAAPLEERRECVERMRTLAIAYMRGGPDALARAMAELPE